MGKKQQFTAFISKLVKGAFFVDGLLFDFVLPIFCLHIKHLQIEGSFAHNREDIVPLYLCCR